MVSSGLEILFDGTNIARILAGMLRVAEISICSLPPIPGRVSETLGIS